MSVKVRLNESNPSYSLILPCDSKSETPPADTSLMRLISASTSTVELSRSWCPSYPSRYPDRVFSVEQTSPVLEVVAAATLARQ
ncbi:hypothetical protein EAI_11204 [Harpegnathos saltator]|uniref:Uncharacterized protein n=1 Tax=Harpegnathos saltator TaxID=610380 RepID=E2BJL0_HARSA|nr:hypothetical protein EAI_11204 [Harpegnathos saltator]